MIRILSKTILFSVVVLTFAVPKVSAQNKSCSNCHRDLKSSIMPDRLSKMHAVSTERGLGIQDKGQVSNYLGNYGTLSNYLEYFNDAVHWPAASNTERQYCFGLGLVVAVKGNVITSVLGGISEKVDWSPKAGSRGKLFSGDVKVTSNDETPFLASSDNPQTWPHGYFDKNQNWVNVPGSRYWPGHFRIDIDPASPAYGKEIAGEFVSDRDIYSVFDDRNNSNPQGSAGIEVEQTAYSYGRPYAENLLFWDFIIHNTSGRQLDSVYVGYYAIFRADYDNKDNINFVRVNPASLNGDFIYIYDINNTKDGAWANTDGPLGMAGLHILETPKNLGITDFHYFTRDAAPKVDEEIWSVISSNPKYPGLTIPEALFHGNNHHIDDTHPDSLKKYYPDGAPINYYVASGPFSLQPDETVKSSLALVMGNSGGIPNNPDTTNLMLNARIAQQMYQRKFQGSGAPKTPKVTASPDDKKVLLSWDADAENSVDVMTGKNDFEGYKIYRSDNQGKTWGIPVTDASGSIVGYKPLKIFDLIDGVKGQDPVFNQSLGEDTGLKHNYIDSNLVNGVEYWYCVTSYDKGNQLKGSLEQSYQSALGKSLLQSNTVAVVPGVKAQNYNPPQYNPQSSYDGAIPPTGGLSDGLVKIDIVQPEKITGDNYYIAFVDSAKQIAGAQIIYALGFNLYRISKTTGDTTLILERQPFTDQSGDNLPVVDGFRLTVKNSASGIRSTGWTRINGDTSTFDWRTGPVPKYKNLGKQIIQENVYTTDDIRITIDTTLHGGLTARWYDYFTDKTVDTLQHLPLKVEIISDPLNPTDISNNTYLYEFSIMAPWDSYRIDYYSPLGWDLLPGGKGFTPGSPGFYEKYVDVLVFEQLKVDPVSHNTTHNGLWLQTNNFPDTYINSDGITINKKAVPPSHNDQFTIITYKPFRKEISYQFSTQKSSITGKQNIELNKIKVVPDPYIVANAFETNQFGKKLMFTNLPNECSISIFTVAGDHVADVSHNNINGYEYWDMRTFNSQYVACGLYVYVVSTPDGQKKTGRFLIIK
ncbi:MAG: hypothetical protein WCJ01_04015 [Ignavibacteria bacterium]